MNDYIFGNFLYELRTQVLTGVWLMIAGLACGGTALAAFFTACGMLFVIRRRTRKNLQKNLGQND